MRHAIDRALATAPATSSDLLRLVVDSGRALLDGHTVPAAAARDASHAAADTAGRDPAGAPRAAAPPSRDTLVRIVLIGAFAFVAYRALRGFKSFAWTLFGLAMMWFWAGGARGW